VCGSPVQVDGMSVCWQHTEDELGISYRQLDYWVRRGYLRPERRTARGGKYGGGQGVSRRWPAAELEIARRMARLTAAGITPERAAVFARESWPSGEIAPGITVEITRGADGPCAPAEAP
jgi:MerR HTH family regulatory protein